MKAAGPALMTEQPGAWLARQLESVCRGAACDLDRLPAAPDTSIHALRLRMKKLRSLLRFIEPDLSQPLRDRLRLRIRGIKNACTETREAAVLRKLAASLRQRHQLPPLRLPLGKTGDESGRGIAVPPLRRRLALLRRDFAALPLSSLTTEAILTRHADRWRSCRRLMKRCIREPGTEDLHRWRRRVKECVFLSMALHALPTARALIRPSKKLGHWLGDYHDLVLLASRAAGPSTDKWCGRLAKDTARLRRRILTEAPEMLAPGPRRLRHRLVREAARASDSHGS